MPTHLSSAVSWVSSPNAEVLHSIKSEGIQLAVWQRLPVVPAQAAVEALRSIPDRCLLDLRIQDFTGLSSKLRSHFNFRSSSLQASLDALACDFQNLGALFSKITEQQHLRLRLERVQDDGCALFHVDTLPVRMVCTYAGPGTQWVEEDNLRRDQLGLRGRSVEEANAAIVIDPRKIHTAAAWQVLVFKGRLWEGHGFTDGLVHRSAPVRHPRDGRLRLTFDFASTCTC